MQLFAKVRVKKESEDFMSIVGILIRHRHFQGMKYSHHKILPEALYRFSFGQGGLKPCVLGMKETAVVDIN